MRKILVLTFLLAVLLPVSHAAAQQDTARLVIDTARGGSGWGAPGVRDLMARASVRRAQPQADTALHNYRATAEGFLYFFLDRRANDERTLVRVNQIGLELYWRQPGVARQRIVGMRDASPLPNTMRYHIDHLTMVQNGFGDVIRVGDGDEVRDVVHPASPRGPGIYEYRLADSLDLRLPSSADPIRVYEVQVRPRRTDQPGFVGSVFVDRQTADIIRMTFTFTPSSYVDKRLDYINLSLDNGLWEGKYWLPNEQTVEIRRQIPEFDFLAGSVIRGRMRINEYQLNVAIPDSIFGTTRAVVAASPEQLKAYPFQRGIFDDVTEAGLSPSVDAERLRREAAELIGAHLLSGLPNLRLYYPDVSSGIRYNRAEGLFLGAGLTYSSGPPWRLDGAAGYAFGSGYGSTVARVSYQAGIRSLSASGYAHAPRDLGPVTALAGVANTLSAAVLGKDYVDRWYATGIALSTSKPVAPGLRVSVTASAEQQRSASLAESHALFNHGADFRPVLVIDRGDDYGINASIDRTTPTRGAIAWGGSLSVRAARFEPDVSAGSTYARPLLHAQLVARTPAHQREFLADLTAATATANAPAQQYFLAGGTGTLPGYPYRSFAGRTGAVLSTQITQQIVYPWLALRGIGAIGGTTDMSRTPATATWPGHQSDGLRASVGAGVSLFWDLLHVEAIKGVNGGKWVVQLSFTRILDDIS